VPVAEEYQRRTGVLARGRWVLPKRSDFTAVARALQVMVREPRSGGAKLSLYGMFRGDSVLMISSSRCARCAAKAVAG